MDMLYFFFATPKIQLSARAKTEIEVTVKSTVVFSHPNQ